MNDRQQQSDLGADDGPFAEEAKSHEPWHGALIVTLCILAITLIMNVDLARVTHPLPEIEERTDHRLDLNSATLSELETLPNIGPLKAQRIIDARPFDSVNDLLPVQGLGPKTLETLRPHIKVSAEAPNSH